MQEMFRVTKEGSYFSLVTHGEPQHRLKFFMNALPKGRFELSCNEVSLSFMSNLINSLRNNSGEESLSDAVKNKDVLLNSVLEACISKLAGNMQNLSHEELEVRKRKILQLKMLKLINKKKNGKNKETDTNSDNEKEEVPIQAQQIEENKEKPKTNTRRTHCYLYIFKKI